MSSLYYQHSFSPIVAEHFEAIFPGAGVHKAVICHMAFKVNQPILDARAPTVAEYKPVVWYPYYLDRYAYMKAAGGKSSIDHLNDLVELGYFTVAPRREGATVYATPHHQLFEDVIKPAYGYLEAKKAKPKRSA